MDIILPPDPYKALGVSKDAKLPEIRSSHRKLVLKCHPDKVQDAALKAIKQEEFQQVQQAYELLSDEIRRLQYDEQVKLFELRKEMGRGNPTPRSNPFEYEIRPAEPRPSSYGRPAPIPKVYTYPAAVPRSHEDLYEEPLRHTPKKSSSYDSSDRKRRDEQRMRDEEESLRQREKEGKRSAHSKKEKSRDKERRRGAEEKVRSRGTGAYVEDDSEDDFRPPPPRSSEKKSSRYRMEEEIRMREEEARARERAAEIPRIKEIPLAPKWDEHKDRAAKYMQAARRKVGAEDGFVHPGMRRSETFSPTAAAYNIRYATPPAAQYSDDEAPRRSSARPKETRRASDTPRRDKSSRRSPEVDPYIISPPSPPPTRKPTLQTYNSAPPAAAEFARTKPMPSRSKTQDYPRHETVPPLPRAATFQSGDRDRGRGSSSRLRKEVASDSDSDSPIYPSPRHSHSPPPRTTTQTRYKYRDGSAVPLPPSRHRSDLHDLNDSYPRERSESPHGTPTRPPLHRNPGSGDPHSRGIPTRSHSNQYYATAPPIGPEPIIHTVRPKMPPRTDSHRGSSRAVPQFYGEVKYSKGFDNVSYATNPADMYASHHHRGSDDRGYHYPPRGREPIYT
jgi:curved DNA-binding protein CbpA